MKVYFNVKFLTNVSPNRCTDAEEIGGVRAQAENPLHTNSNQIFVLDRIDVCHLTVFVTNLYKFVQLSQQSFACCKTFFAYATITVTSRQDCQHFNSNSWSLKDCPPTSRIRYLF